MDLKNQIEIVVGLNIDTHASSISLVQLLQNTSIDADSFVVSDCDEELLVLIEFKKVVDLQSMKIYASKNTNIPDLDFSAPKEIHICKISHLSYNFADVQSMKPHKSVECSINKLHRGQYINLKYALEFKAVKYLAIYIQSNQSDAENTYINGITFEGSGKCDIQKPSIHFDETDQDNLQKFQKMSEFAHSDTVPLVLDSRYLLKHHRSDRTMISNKQTSNDHTTKISNKQTPTSPQRINKESVLIDPHYDELQCLCGAQMEYIEVKLAYPHAYPHGAVKCDMCHNTYTNQQKIYHCKAVNEQKHPNGFDLCKICARQQYRDYHVDNQNMEIKNTIRTKTTFNFLRQMEKNQNSSVVKDKPTKPSSASCCTLDECDSIQYLVTTLTSYNDYIFYKQEEKKSDIQIFSDEKLKFTDVLNHFHHLLDSHGHQFEEIYTILLGKCNGEEICALSGCLMMRRNHRDRSSLRESTVALKGLYFGRDTKQITMQQIMDTIHCHYFHSYDTGYKLPTIDQHKIETMVNNDDMKQNCTHDKVLKAIRNIIIEKEEPRTRELNKFSSTLNEPILRYSFGIRYFYWPYYKPLAQTWDPMTVDRMGRNLGLKDPDPANHGYLVKDFFVEAKHKNLKDELVNNETFRLSKTQWNILMQKVLQQLCTNKYKATINRAVGSKEKYQIAYDSLITCHHLLAMMVYCNQDMLQAKFTETYRRIPQNESNVSLIKRHKNYAHLGRLLVECIHCFGPNFLTGAQIVTTRLYHGIDKVMNFSSTDACIKGPVSTTTDISVAVNFSAHKGMILELCLNEESSMKFCGGWFDCQYISDYSNEQEIFFIAGYNNFIFLSILEAPTGNNYRFYIYALSQLARNLSYGTIYPKFHNWNFGIKDVAEIDIHQLALRMLLDELHRYWPNNKKYIKFKSMPEYARNLLHNHCSNIVEIGLQYEQPKSTYYTKLFSALFYYDYKWIKLKLLVKLFPSIKFIFVWNKKLNEKIMQLESVYLSVLSLLGNMNCHLQRISIFIPFNAKKQAESVIKPFIARFNQKKWTLYVNHNRIKGELCIVMESLNSDKIQWMTTNR